jgi:hypothetical protein
MPPLPLAVIVAFLGVLLPAHARGQPAADVPDPTASPARLITAGRVAEPPAIDGRLDDPPWRTAARIDDFVQQRPLDGAPATEQTEIYVAYDNQRLYVGIYAHYSDTALIRANRLDRDRTDNDDTVAIVLDPFHDQQLGYSLSVNGYGVQGDSILRGGGGGGSGDTSWDALFDSAARFVDDGWTAEMAIPFKSLRYPTRGRGEAHRWGFQIQREIRSKDESVVWSPVSRDVMGFLAQMGVLDGLSDLSTSRNLEVLPTFTAIHAGALSTDGDFSTDHVEEGGVNVKYGITSNLTFDFSFNPDFSQIESDRQQIEVNQRFPISYPELRPFFLEGQDIFRIMAPVTMVHTRTIVDPRFGAKLSGKIGKTTLGVVVANDEAPGKTDDSSDPWFEQSAQVLLSRFRYDLRSESHVGAFFTDREFLDSHSRLAGVDAQFRLGRNHRLATMGAMTRHRSTDGTSATGRMIEMNFRREARSLSYFIASYGIDPDFRTETGFIRRVDQKVLTGNLTYRWWPESWVVNWGPRVNYERNYDFTGTLQDEGTGARVNVQLVKNISFEAGVQRDMERYRGIDFRKTGFSFDGRIDTSRRIAFSGSFNAGDEIHFIADPYLGRSRSYGLSTTLRPFSRLQASINLDTTRFVDVRDDALVFDIKLLRTLTTFQFTDRLLIRNIIEHDTLDRTSGVNVLLTYRVNAGTVFFLGYDDRFRQDPADGLPTSAAAYRRTNRAIFTKLQYLLRY